MKENLFVHIKKIIQSDVLISVAVVSVAVLFFVGYVWADPVTTTVTVGNEAPTMTVTLDRTTITLNENTFVWASTTLTITDNNGCTEITSADNVQASLIFASSTVDQVAGLCGSSDSIYSYNANYCFNAESCIATTTGTTCSTTVVEYDCGFKVWYSALPTDGSAPGADLIAATWFVVGSTTDGSLSGNATNTTQAVEVATLNSIDITGTIAYDQTSAGSDTGTTDQTVTITNTGNTALDSEISGDVMCTDYSACTGDTFTESQQKFHLSAGVDYGSKTYTLAATSGPATIETLLATTTATTTPITDDTYWGIAIPGGQPAGSYTGQNTITGVAD